jgi:hypothetical protein
MDTSLSQNLQSALAEKAAVEARIAELDALIATGKAPASDVVAIRAIEVGRLAEANAEIDKSQRQMLGFFAGAREFEVGEYILRFVVRQRDSQDVNWRADIRRRHPGGSLSTEISSWNCEANARNPDEAFDRFVDFAAEHGVTILQRERAACLSTYL